MGNLMQLGSMLMVIMGNFSKVTAAIEFLHASILEVERADQTGEQKLDSVLNGFEVYLNTNFPAFATPFEEIATVVKAVVADVIGAYNLFSSLAPAKGGAGTL